MIHPERPLYEHHITYHGTSGWSLCRCARCYDMTPEPRDIDALPLTLGMIYPVPYTMVGADLDAWRHKDLETMDVAELRDHRSRVRLRLSLEGANAHPWLRERLTAIDNALNDRAESGRDWSQ